MFIEFQFAEDTIVAARVFPGMGVENLSTKLQTEFNQHIRQIANNSTLLIEGDECRAVYFVVGGWLSLSKALAEGQNQIIDFALPGDFVDPAGGDGMTSSVTIDALTDGTLAVLPYRRWTTMPGEWPELHSLTHLMEAAKNARRAERMLRLGKGTAEMRVAYALVEFCIRIASVCGSEIAEFHIPLTQQQLGDFVGLSSVHVCRTMRRMVRNGVIEMSDHMDIRVLDSRSLARLAGVDIESLKRGIVPLRL